LSGGGSNHFYKEVHMIKSFVALCAVAGILGLSACSGMGRGETIGTVGGAAAGGAVGSAVTGGSTLGTLGGAAIGGYAGHEAGSDYDKKHQ
jgi:osmotically inducible lipoprotein OsmB